MNFSVPVSFITEYKALPTLEGSTCGGGGGIACLSRVYTPCARMGAYTRACRHSCLYFCRRLRPAHTRAYADCRRQSSNMLNFHGQRRPALAFQPITKAPERPSPRADALFCIGTYAGVFPRIRSRVYTFIHGAICAMQWRRTGRRKRRRLRRLPAHTRAWGINPA